jgi:hypothetical protein
MDSTDICVSNISLARSRVLERLAVSAGIVRGGSTVAKQKTKTEDREKLAVWIDRVDLEKMRKLQDKFGVNVSTLVRWFIHDGLEHERHPLQK